MPELLLNAAWVFISAVMGLLIGSFLNVCIYRLPAGITIVRGRSFCPSCHHSLAAPDLVPVFSYLFLGRRCRYCREPISPRYARIELLSGLYFALAGWFWRPWIFEMPVYLQKWLAGLDAVTLDSARLLTGMALTATSALAFSALLVWAMIWFDGHLPPRSLPAFVLAPALLRLLLQPQRLLGHVAALALALLVFFLLAAFRLLPDAERKSRLSLAGGLASLALMGGLQAIQPVLAIFLVELLLLAFFQNRARRSEPAKKRALQVWRSLPLQGVLIGSVLWLLF